MQSLKKVEITISTLGVNEVLNILDTIQVSGYTVIENTSDKDLGKEFSNSYIMTVCTNEKQLSSSVDEILPLIN